MGLCRIMGRYKLYVASDDVGFGANVLLDGLWESWLTIFMAKRLQLGMNVVDVGANHGYYTLLFADIVGPKGRVAAVEPNPAACALLRRSISLNGFTLRVSVIEVAAGASENTQVILHVPPHEPKNAHVLDWSGNEEAGTNGISVVTRCLSSLLHEWARVDFIKVDVEGAEEAVVGGALPMLERDRPDVVLEFNCGRCHAPAELLDRLEHIYGPLRVIGFDSELHRATREELLDQSNREDWLVFLSMR